MDSESDEKSKSKTGFSDWWNKQSDGKKVIFVIGGIIGIFLIIGISTLVISFNSVVSQSSLAVVPTNTSNNIIILNSTGGADGDKYRIKGTVLNNNSYAADFVKIIVKAYDKNGKLVKEDFTYVYYGYDTAIPAKAQGEFEKAIDDPNSQIVRYEVTVASARQADEEPTTSTTPQIGGQEDKAISIVKNYGNGWVTIQHALDQTAKASEDSGNYISGGTWTAMAIDSSNYKVVYSIQENGATIEAIFNVNIDTEKVTGSNDFGKDTVSVAET